MTAWIGNSAPIAARHYLQVTDADFEKALQRDAKADAFTTQSATRKATQQPTGDSGTSWQNDASPWNPRACARMLYNV